MGNCLTCEAIDDRPSTFNKLKQFLRESGIDCKVTSQLAIWGHRTGLIGDSPSNEVPAPMLIDKHFDNLDSLAALHHPHISTTVAEVGYKILVEVILPKIRDGYYADTPIGLVSAREIEKERNEFRARYKDEFKNVFFFSKNDEDGPGAEEARLFVEASLEYCSRNVSKLKDKDSESNQLSRSEQAEAFFTVIQDVQSTLEFSDQEICQIFEVNVENFEISVNDFLGLGSDYWQEKATILLRLKSNLTRFYSHARNPSDEARDWMESEYFEHNGNYKNAREVLLTGNTEETLDVLYRSLRLPEQR